MIQSNETEYVSFTKIYSFIRNRRQSNVEANINSIFRNYETILPHSRFVPMFLDLFRFYLEKWVMLNARVDCKHQVCFT